VRIVLEIGVHQGDDGPVGVVYAGLEGGGLPEVAAKQDGAHRIGMGLRQVRYLLGAGIRAAVVHVDDLVAQIESPQHLDQFLVNQGQTGFLIVNRQNNRKIEWIGMVRNTITHPPFSCGSCRRPGRRRLDAKPARL
jgi:hypothetical protein